MKFKKVGNSGLIVSDLSLGTMLFGEESGRGTSKEEAIKQVDYYIDQGGDHIDTANVYAAGRSEEILGKAIKGKRDKVTIATKVRFPKGEGNHEQGLSRLHIVSEVENSLRRMDTDHIDLYYMHCWDPLTPIEESLDAFDQLVTSGKVRYIGVSNFKAWQLMKSLGLCENNGWARFVGAQYQYSLVKRDIEYEYVDLMEQEGLSLLPWGPLGGGFLSGKYKADQKPDEASGGRIGTTEEHTEEAWERRATAQNWRVLEKVEKIAKERGTGHAQIAIAWLRSKSYVASVILGARTFDQLKANMESATIDLTPEEVTVLDEISTLPELYPYRMIEAYAMRSL